MRYSQRSRVPKLEMHRVGTVLAKSWWVGVGGTLHPGSVCLSEHRDHISMTPKLPVLC